ncbi:MAG: riboflavin biosynthesis protein RibF, partial [Chloroflexi bacterium]|nr:riboflavin biosynthesis protein RibF [Chloroflexota bacterium]
DATEFMQIMQVTLGVKELIIGHDFALGQGRKGNYEALKKLGQQTGFNVTKVPPVQINGQTVSSTNIRMDLAENELIKATSLLGHNYMVLGKVVEGAKRGRLWGFPTANINVPLLKLLPKGGVYAVKVTVEKTIYDGVLNIGYRPTFDASAKTFEVHLLNFNGNLYGKELRTDIISFIRNEIRFENVEQLAIQIQEDVQKAHTILKETR